MSIQEFIRRGAMSELKIRAVATYFDPFTDSTFRRKIEAFDLDDARESAQTLATETGCLLKRFRPVAAQPSTPRK